MEHVPKQTGDIVAQDQSNNLSDRPSNQDEDRIVEDTEHGLRGHSEDESVSDTNERGKEDGISEETDIIAAMVNQLLNFHGCSDVHARCNRQQDSASSEPETGSNGESTHLSLQDFAQLCAELPNTLHNSNIMLPGTVNPAEAEGWEPLYTGAMNGNVDDISEICVDCSTKEEHLRQVEIEFDIDSVLGFSTSLAFAKQGFSVEANPQVTSNLHRNVHLTIGCPTINGRTKQVPLHKVPHMKLGRVTGFEKMDIYVFFPRLFRSDLKNNYLKQETIKQWMDTVLMPAMYSNSSSSASQHYPADFADAVYRCQAAYSERPSRSALPSARTEAQIHHVSAPTMTSIWENVLRSIEKPGLQHFRDATIFFSAKNLKGTTKRKTLKESWEFFTKMWDYTIDEEYISPTTVWVDFAKEFCASKEELDEEQESEYPTYGEVYVWRECCLDSYREWARHGAEDRPSLWTKYQSSLLRDAPALTILTSPSSLSRKKGLLYTQLYMSDKELFDANKHMPFMHETLEALALDEELIRAVQSAGKAKTYTPASVRDAYQKAKTRVSNAIKKSLKRSFGVREESRYTLAMIRSIMDGLRSTAMWHQKVVMLENAVVPFRRIRTDVYFDYLASNINKFTTIIECILTFENNAERITWDHSQVLIMFIRLLKASISSHQLSRLYSLWTRTAQSRKTLKDYYGAGLSETVPKYGYGWIINLLDWSNLTFRLALTGSSLFGNISIASKFTARAAAVRMTMTDMQLADALGRLLQKHTDDGRIRTEIHRTMAWLCLRAFRKDVWSSVHAEILPGHLQKALSGEITLCKTNVEALRKKNGKAREYVIPTGNKMRFKVLAKFIDYLWDSNDGIVRKHWEDKPYRQLFQRCKERALQAGGGKAEEEFACMVKRLFPMSNWYCPCPTSNSFWTLTKGCRRLWLSIYNRPVATLEKPCVKANWDTVSLRSFEADWIVGRHPEDEVMEAIAVVDAKYERLEYGEIETAINRIADGDMDEPSDQLSNRPAKVMIIVGAGGVTRLVPVYHQ